MRHPVSRLRRCLATFLPKPSGRGAAAGECQWSGLEPLESRALLSAAAWASDFEARLMAPEGRVVAIEHAASSPRHDEVSGGWGTLSGGAGNPAVIAGTGGTSATGGSGLESSALSAFNIVINAGAGLAANAAALAAFERAAAQWESRISDPITVTISANLSNLGANVIGQTSAVMIGYNYDVVRNPMVADAADESDDGIVGALPTAAQVSFSMPSGLSFSGGIQATKANLKALGFTGLDEERGATDATITFNSAFPFDYSNADGVSGSQMDFETVAAHEIGHALGFISAVDNVDYYMGGGFGLPFFNAMPLDLFRFQNNLAGADPATTAEFTTMQRSLRPNVDAVTDGIAGWGNAAAENRMSTGYYTGDGRQASHWKDGDLSGLLVGAMDPTLAYGQTFAITDADWRALDLIGWDVAGPAIAGVNVSPLSLTTTEAGGTAQLSVSLKSAPTAPVTIDLSTTDATEGLLVGAGGALVSGLSLTFTPENWSTPQSVTVKGIDDSLADGNVAYKIVTAAAVSSDSAYQGLNADDVAVINTDNDQPTVSIGDAARTEGRSGAKTLMTFTVSLSGPSSQSVTVRYATANGTATTSNKDYTAVTGTLTFAPGETTKTVTVTIVGDNKREADENFFVNLTNPTNATIADAQGRGTILNDD